ncbi:hypothetical protein [Knoellia sinensis]|uniref:hypothetical protein n=1 Tax=Knoellia sinensis TaxID=136100 RepID=UPI001B806DB9|nr:hypothetical protein [Knoellia sinensis]
MGTTPRSRFWWHYLEMVVAMLIGMGVFWPVWVGLFAAIGRPDLLDRGDVAAVQMALNMTAGMAIWMKIRGHRWQDIVEMSIAMSAPFFVLLVPHWLGLLSAGALMLAAHTLMFVTMLLAMWWRKDVYTADHASHAHGHHVRGAAVNVPR